MSEQESKSKLTWKELLKEVIELDHKDQYDFSVEYYLK